MNTAVNKHYDASKETNKEDERLVLNLHGKMSITSISKHTGFPIPYINAIVRKGVRDSLIASKFKKKPKKALKEPEPKNPPRKTIHLHSRAETTQMSFEQILAYRKYQYLPWCGVAYFDEKTDRLSIGEERKMQAEHDVLFVNRRTNSNRNDTFLI